MSHKGAIKKVSSIKDGQPTTVKSKLKSSLPNESGDHEKVNIKTMRTSQTLERIRESDSHSRLSHNVESRKSNTKQTVRPTKNISIKENASSSSKINIASSQMSSKNILTSKTVNNPVKKTTSNNAVKTSKSSNGRMQSGYSEKRGVSTIFVPQSMTSKLNAKLANKDAISTTNNEEQIRTRRSQEESEASETNIKSRQRTLSRTLSPSEVKMLHSATTRSNASQKLNESNDSQPESAQVDNTYDYEDDFEDYESDFQECTESDSSEVSEEASVNHQSLPLNPIELNTAKQLKIVNSTEQKEEEHMHDSGHYELTEARKRAARIESITNDPKLASLLEIKHPVNKSYSEDRTENKSLPSSTDEGFEDSRSGDFAKSPPLSQISFIDFHKSKEEQRTKKSKKTLNRGEELLQMIKLDIMEWSLLECSPIPYEKFIRSYGNLNAQQTSTQTGEDNIDVETQTDEIICNNKWTQFPITCRTNLMKSKESLYLFQMDQIGVGSDNDTENINSLPSLSIDVLRLSDFMNHAGSVMLSLLEERRSSGNVSINEEKISFSDDTVKLSIDSVTFLAGRTITMIYYSEIFNKILLTVHSPVEEEIETSWKQDHITDCCIGSVWNISEASMPIKLFYSTCPINACCFHSTNYNVVFAGLQDGSISLWDLKEDEMWHHKVSDKANKLDWIIRMPTYTTATNMETDNNTSGIVTIRILSKIEERTLTPHSNKFVPIQICSLNENGSVIIWSVLYNMGKNVNDLGLSFWGRIRLVKSQELQLQSYSIRKRINAATFIDMHVDSIDNNSLYVVTNNSSVLHATCIGNKANPALYTKLYTSPCGNATCIDTCPFKQSLFLVCCDDGTIRLHSANSEKPILQLKDPDNTYTIKAVQWSKSKAFTIFVLDNNSCIHIWDLSNSDIYPTHTINMQKSGCVTSIQLSSCKTTRDASHQYLALATETGSVEIHKLKTDFYYSKKEEYVKELDTFMRYVAIL